MINPFSKDNPDKRILLPVWCAVDGIGLQTAMLSPWIIGVYIANYQFSVVDAGLLMSLEFAALTIVSFAVAPMITCVRRDVLAISGALMVFAGNASSIFIQSWDLFCIVRIIAGVGYGLAMAAGNAVAAGAQNPTQLYGHKLALFAVFAFGTMLIIPTLIEYSPKYLFAAMAATNLILITPLRKLPQQFAENSKAHTATVSQKALPLQIGVVSISMVLAMLTFFVRDTFVYVFSERIGIDVGLSREQIGIIFALSAFLGVLGPLLSIWFGMRFGNVAALLLVVTLDAILTVELFKTQSALLYTALMLVWPILNLAGFALLMGLAAQLDRIGRLTTVCGGVVLGSYAIGPAAAGYLMAMDDERAVVFFLAFCAVICVLSLIVIQLKQVQKQGAPSCINQ